MRAHAVRSEDNHFFYSYDGEWKHGRMDGWGTYKFADGLTYSNLAVLRLKLRQKVQLALISVAALTSMCLLASLG